MSAVTTLGCDLLEALFEGSTGTCYLGVITTGPHSGRPALLRPMPELELAKASAVLPILEVLSRPSSTKILGLASAAGTDYLASEYIDGVSLLELEAAASARGERLPVAVAVRAIQDALLAAHSTQSLLAKTGGLVIVSTLSAESIWVATYGEVYLTELGIIAGLLAAAPPRPGAPARGLEPNPVRAAGAELSRLIAREGSSRASGAEKQALPATMASIIEMALSTRPGHRFSGPATMAEALLSLPAGFAADSRQLAAEVERLVGEKLLRRRSLAVSPAQSTHFSQPVRDDTQQCDDTQQYDVRGIHRELQAALERGLERSKKARWDQGVTPDSSEEDQRSVPLPDVEYGGAEEEETRHYDIVDGEAPMVSRAFECDTVEEEVTRHYDADDMLAALERDTVPPYRAVSRLAPTAAAASSTPVTHLRPPAASQPSVPSAAPRSPLEGAAGVPEALPPLNRSLGTAVSDGLRAPTRALRRPPPGWHSSEPGKQQLSAATARWAAMLLAALALGILVAVGSGWF